MTTIVQPNRRASAVNYSGRRTGRTHDWTLSRAIIRRLEKKGWKIGSADEFLDLLVKTLLALGASDRDLANVIAADTR